MAEDQWLKLHVALTRLRVGGINLHQRRDDAQLVADALARLKKFVAEFDKWHKHGEGVADSEGGFDPVLVARNLLGE